MRLPGGKSRHLTYCTNIHPGESWAEVQENLLGYVLPVRDHVCAGAPFGLGLRLSARAARELGEGDRLGRFRTVLREHDLYVFTINGFPHGAFHGQPVKEEVYRPDWLEEPRLEYTNRLADVLADLLPDGIEGTISTVPGAFAPRVGGTEDAQRMAFRIARHVGHLLHIRESTGRSIALALEPEPCCHLETIDETVRFFEQHLFAPAAAAVLEREAGLSTGEAEEALRRHVGVCFDTCHMAVEFEDPAAALARLRGAGIRLLKVQVSAGLRVELGDSHDGETLGALERFADDVYLHQVVERGADEGLRRYLDLGEAIAAARGGGGAREWRVHFHVPLFYSHLGRFRSTQEYVREALELLRTTSECEHFEVETYTWDVLPEEFREQGIVAAVSREVEWTAACMQETPAGGTTR